MSAPVYVKATDTCGKSSEIVGPLMVQITNSPIPPTVTNGIGATLITTNSARPMGEITSTGGQHPSVTLFWGPTDGGEKSGIMGPS